MSKKFEEHILPGAQKMYRYALSIIKDKDIAYDVVQDCLEKIWRKKATLEQVALPEAWAMRIVRNQCLDWFRKSRYDVSPENHQIDGHYNADDRILFDDQEMWLEKTLDSLPRKQKEVFLLRDIEGFTYQEIAETLELSLDDVKVTLHRTRKLVRDRLQMISNYGIAN